MTYDDFQKERVGDDAASGHAGADGAVARRAQANGTRRTAWPRTWTTRPAPGSMPTCMVKEGDLSNAGYWYRRARQARRVRQSGTGVGPDRHNAPRALVRLQSGVRSLQSAVRSPQYADR